MSPTHPAPVEPLSPGCPRPVRRARLVNSWDELTFLHWPCEPAAVQALLPDALRVDTTPDGAAWVSLVPFVMRDARPGWAPAVPWLSTFAETNVRTYVVDPEGRRAVWFMSLEASRLPVVALARWAFGFPYVWSEMSVTVDGDRRRYETVRRRWPRSMGPSTTVVEVEVGEPIHEPDDLDVFLTARWGAVASRRGRLRHHPVDHPTWSLRAATLVELADTSITAGGLAEPSGAPVVRHATRIPARFGAPDLLTV